DDLEHQVRADVAGPDHGNLGAHSCSPSVKRTRTEPSGWMCATSSSPAFTGASGPSAPDSTISPARSGAPNSIAVRGSQATAASGSPRQAAPVPDDASAPLVSIRMVTSRGTKADSATWALPSTNTPLDALSATVSVIAMSQSRTRLSTISMAGLA